jgi:hypothetical protein
MRPVASLLEQARRVAAIAWTRRRWPLATRRRELRNASRLGCLSNAELDQLPEA